MYYYLTLEILTCIIILYLALKGYNVKLHIKRTTIKECIINKQLFLQLHKNKALQNVKKQVK